MPVIDRHEEVVANIERLVRGCHVLGVPILLTEQYVKGLGPTVSGVRRALVETSGYAPIEKSCFSAHGCADFEGELQRSGRRQVLLAGVETHVCVNQTALDLLAAGYGVFLVADALSSRTAGNREIALGRLAGEGATVVSTEMALFELLAVSGTDEFRAIYKLIK